MNWFDLQQLFRKMQEDAPVNATGAAVAGTGDDIATWRKKKKKKHSVDDKDFKLFTRTQFTGESFDSIIDNKTIIFDLKRGYTVLLENKQTGEITTLCLES
jgi:hypothetical protein